MSVEEVLDRFDEEQLRSWHALAAIDGWGRDDERIAQLCAVVSNLVPRMLAAKAGSEDACQWVQFEEFVPRFLWERRATERQPESSDDVRALSMRMAGF